VRIDPFELRRLRLPLPLVRAFETSVVASRRGIRSGPAARGSH
jgi:hypothetical protein